MDPRPGVLLAWLLLLCGLLPAQTVHLANLHTMPWQGWKQVTCGPRPAADAGVLLSESAANGDVEHQIEAMYRVGRRVGLDVWVVDVWTKLGAGQRRTFDLGAFADVKMPMPPQLPLDLGEYFGGWPAIDGTPLSLDYVRIDGAGWLSHWRSRLTGHAMLIGELWVKWYPEHGWCQCEAMITCSNPNVPDMGELVSSPIRVTFGDAVPMVLGQGSPGVLVPAGTRFADGQGRMVPLTLAWLRHLRDPMAGASAICDWNRAIGGIGTVTAWPDGQPRTAPGFDGQAWAAVQLPGTLQRLHDWRVQTTGPNARSGDTGAQTGDQVFVGAECFPPDGRNVAGNELVRYLGAMKLAARPCHHSEPNGAPLDPAAHPNLCLWDGQVHSSSVVSPDRLGKPRSLDFSSGETSGWWGPDVEHFFHNSLSLAVRLTGSPGLQYIERNQCVVWRLQQTTSPPKGAIWATNAAFASRAFGYESIRAVQYWRDLEDRDEAQRGRDHYLRRWNGAIRTETLRIYWRDGFYDSGKISPWQALLATYGVDLAGRVFDLPEAREQALREARLLVEDDFYLQGGQPQGPWRCYSTLLLSAGTPDPIADNTFFLFGGPMGVWIARQDPGYARAASIWAQMLGDATQSWQASWLPPGNR